MAEQHPLPPNALSSFETIRTLLQGKRPVVFLDYDGTLAPIVKRPDQAFMTDTMRAAVKNVAQKFVTAVVSGRSTQKVVNFVKLDELFYAGSHGLDITGPNWPLADRTSGGGATSNDDDTTGDTPGDTPGDTTGDVTGAAAANEGSSTVESENKENNDNTRKSGLSSQPVKHRVAQTFLPVLNSCRGRILTSINATLGADSNVEIEDNLLTFSVHYRNAVNCSAEEVRKVIDDVLIDSEYTDQLVCTAGKMVYEVRPQVQWNKGAAVLWLLETLGMNAEDNVIALYLGDDITDEDAFRALSESSWKGRCASIVVQGELDRKNGAMHRPTSALWSLKDTIEVQQFLELLSMIG